MRLATGDNPRVERMYASLRDSLDIPGGRAGAFAAVTDGLLTDLRAAMPFAAISTPTAGVDEADSAERIVRGRLELAMAELEPALQSVAGPAGENVRVHLRPMRSGLYAAMTLPDGPNTLIVIDDALHDFTYNTVQRMVAVWTSPHVEGVTSKRSPGPLSMREAIRVTRTELASMQWNGALWQPLEVLLPRESKTLAQVVTKLVLYFVIAHETAHALYDSAVVVVDDESSMYHLDDTRAELDADIFAAKVLEAHLLGVEAAAVGGDASAPGLNAELADLARAAVTCALGVIELIESHTLAARPPAHPVPGDRFAAIEAAVHWPKMSNAGIERIVEVFLDAAFHMSTPSDEPSLRTVVAASPFLRFHRSYSDATLAQLDALDRVERYNYTPLPRLLRQLGDLAPDGPYPPIVVAAVARVQDDLDGSGETRPVSAETVVRCCVGKLILDAVLASLPFGERAATLDPEPGTRFVDWALWVERECAAQWIGVLIAAVAVYRDEGVDAAGEALRSYDLPEAVTEWLSSASPTGLNGMIATVKPR